MFIDGLGVPRGLLCIFLGSNFPKLSVPISLRRLSDAKRSCPFEFGAGESGEAAPGDWRELRIKWVMERISEGPRPLP